MSNRVEHQKLNQEAAELPPGWVFGVQLGLRQTQSLIKTKTIGRGRLPPATLLLRSKLLLNSNVTGGNLPLPIVLVLICDWFCRRPSWTPKTQPGGSSAASWLSFWCSTRLDIPEKKWPGWRGKPCKGVHFYEGGSSAATWLSFWCSTRLLIPEKKWPGWRGKPCIALYIK